MNTLHHRTTWGIALAAGIMTFASACGDAPASISEPVQQQVEQPADPQPGVEQSCHGAPQLGGYVCEDVEKDASNSGGSADDRRRPNAIP